MDPFAHIVRTPVIPPLLTFLYVLSYFTYYFIYTSKEFIDKIPVLNPFAASKEPKLWQLCSLTYHPTAFYLEKLSKSKIFSKLVKTTNNTLLGKWKLHYWIINFVALIDICYETVIPKAMLQSWIHPHKSPLMSNTCLHHTYHVLKTVFLLVNISLGI